VEFLAGSLECQFAQSRSMGTGILKSVLHNTRDLNEKGKTQLTRWLDACTAAQNVPANAPDAPTGDLVDAAAHFQTPGLHSFGKAGYLDHGEHVSGVVVSPIATPDLLAPRVPVAEPQKALETLQNRGFKGRVIGSFVVVGTDPHEEEGIGNCLESYLGPLEHEFDIDPPEYMVTVYTTHWTDMVYDNASKLHGLDLPRGVVAHSVLEDMSLSGVASPDGCGSLGHELVHLLIKPKFAMAPAWLEEGLASEVAVSAPGSDHFGFSWSWRDVMLENTLDLRPTVAKLLETSWGDFNAINGGDMRRAASLQAMAAIFIRYLDAKGKLREVYLAARDRHINADLSQYRSYREIVEHTLGENVDKVDRDFVA
jgi:hypothetical protein